MQLILSLCQMVKIEHSIFALPYAFAGAILATKGLPALDLLVYLSLAMVGVRSFAMSLNRILDKEIDALNPRTQKRHLVTGEISLKQAWTFCILMALIFIIACALINKVCLALSLPALIIAGGYSLAKRFTPWCHFWLGATLALAPLAGWLTVNPDFLGLPAILLSLSVLFWVAAFDIYYSFQDYDFDCANKVYSLPANYGANTAFVLAGFSHAITIIFLFLVGLAANLGYSWYLICLIISAILIIEHKIISPKELQHINMAFFTLNGAISILMLIGIILSI